MSYILPDPPHFTVWKQGQHKFKQLVVELPDPEGEQDLILSP